MYRYAKVMAEADSRLSSHPATAQVANQQGEYLAKELNAGAANTAHQPAPFMYKHLGGAVLYSTSVECTRPIA